MLFTVGQDYMSSTYVYSYSLSLIMYKHVSSRSVK